MSIFSKMILKSTYASVYGRKAKIHFKENIIEIVENNRKIIHDKASGRKIEETIYDENKVKVIKYSEDGKIDTEEVFVNGEKVAETKVSNGRTTSVDVSKEGLEKLESMYKEDGVEVKETTYKYLNKYTGMEYEIIVIEKEGETLRSIVKKKENDILIDIQKKVLSNNRVSYYKGNGIEVEIEYYGDTRKIKLYSRHSEEPIYEEVVTPQKGKKSLRESDSNAERKQIGTKIIKEILQYNEKGNIVSLETNDSKIVKEFDENGSCNKQYNIVEKNGIKEIVGKIIIDGKDVKMINNSTFPNDVMITMNEEMDTLEFKYEDNIIMLYDFMFWDDGVEVTEEYYLVNNKFELKKRIYDKLENNVDYHIEEKFINNKIYATRKTNKLSKTQLYSEGSKRFITGYNGKEKEVTVEEFELYKMADELNKI